MSGFWGYPNGVSINVYGLITVSENAALDKENHITVQAEYHEHIYRTKLYIKCGIYTPRYLGACYTPTGTQTVLIKIGNGEPIPYIANQGDWVAYMGETEGVWWEKGAVMRFTGLTWEKVDPLAMSSSALYLTAMDDLLEGAPGATFLYAIIGKIFTRHIVMTKDGVIESEGFKGVDGNVPGFKFSAANGLLEANGAIFNKATVRGHVEADSGTFNNGVFTNITVTGKSILQGEIKPTTGIQISHFWGAFSNRTQNDWYQVF
jgi:hypothetical protein